MPKAISSVCLLALGTACLSAPAFAVPVLQLDIEGGSYDSATETIVATGPLATVRALGDHGAKKFQDEAHYLSIAVLPSPQPSTAPFAGSIEIDGTVYGAGDFVFGNPPLEADLSKDGADLPPHGIFPAWFLEIAFLFDPGVSVSAYNTEDQPGAMLDFSGDDLLLREFVVDTSNLDLGLDLHFDLYNTRLEKGDRDIDYKAPFSHDAELYSRKVPAPGVPAILVFGLLAFALRGGRADPGEL